MVRVRKVDPLTYYPILADLQKECLPSDEPCPVKPGDIWFIGFDGQEPACFGVVRPLVAGMWYLARAGVRDKYRGQGLQRRLIKSRIRAAKAQGATTIVTDTTATNAPSANSLIRCGFRVYVPAWRWALPNSIYWRFQCASK